jgi:hypothetical protein
MCPSIQKTRANHLLTYNRNQRRLPVRLVAVLAVAAPFLSFFDFAVCVRVLLVAGELAVSASPSSASLSSASPASLSPSSSPSSSSSASSMCSSSVPTLAEDGRSISTCSLVLRVPRVDALVGLPRRPRDGAGEERGSIHRVSSDLHISMLQRLLPSVSATVLPLLDSGCTDVSGDSDRSAASRLANIISPYSSSGNSKGQYSDSSESSAS